LRSAVLLNTLGVHYLLRHSPDPSPGIAARSNESGASLTRSFLLVNHRRTASTSCCFFESNRFLGTQWRRDRAPPWRRAGDDTTAVYLGLAHGSYSPDASAREVPRNPSGRVG